MLRLYNTLERAVVDFVPRDEGKVGIYVCGPTVQADPHVGHGRSAVAFDVIARYLRWSGYDVALVRNVTDVDDKIIARAKEEGEDPIELAHRYEQRFSDAYKALGALEPDVEPRATENIEQMHEIIEVLIDKGRAYPAGDDVYFSVRTDEDYGRLSRRDIDEMRTGTRIGPNESKQDPLDFALWKGAKSGEPWWDSPWGSGRPGWHIECSAMAARYLGADFDIHGGGNDLIFPHHENEIAQSESATGKRFARYWLHNGMVNLGGAKMSKSIGNVIDLPGAIEKYGGMALRLLFLRAHYRAPIEFSEELVSEAAEALRRIARLVERAPGTDRPADPATLDRFRQAMDDDFSTPEALAVVFDAVREANRMLDDDEDATGLVAAISEMLAVLGLDLSKTAASSEVDVDVTALTRLTDQHGQEAAGAARMVESLLDVRAAARAERDFTRADQIRDDLAAAGVVVEDTPDGARWVRT